MAKARIEAEKARMIRSATDRAERAEAKAKRLEQAIREHHRQVVNHENWGADDELWAALALKPRPETYAKQRAAA